MPSQRIPYLVLAAILAVFDASAQTAAPKAAPVPQMTVTSTVFKDGAMIPLPYTCTGVNISPPLSWEGAPANAETFAVICDDPDASYKPFTHWVLYNIPKDVHTLPENIPATGQLTNGALQGLNDFRKVGYRGPCPPSGIHRYYFRVYALNATLLLLGDVTKDKLLEAMKDKVVAQGVLMGRYGR
jgi:Raf kinase inhibitor-like YbhB/YbcL family protein